MISQRPNPLRGQRNGFALLITITLLAFLVLLLVSLASLTRVETQVAANNTTLNQARQNALVGLNVALGRLQQLAGPDQRITAKADIIDGRSDTKQHWSGVWDSDPSSANYRKNIGWLVSGVASGTDVEVASSVTAPSGESLEKIVRTKTVGTDTATDEVVVATQTIKSTGVPGVTGQQSVGKFAYWVADQGVKANVALVDPWHDGSATERAYSFINMQRSGIELVRFNASEPIESAYPANDAKLAKILSLKQLPLLATGANADRLSTAALNRYHDLTTVSSSIHADVVKGGLKKDLTNWINHGAPPGAIEVDSAPIVTTGEGSAFGLPAWGLVRSFANTRNQGVPLSPQEQTRDQHGVAPVMTYFRMGLNISGEVGSPLNIHLFPEVVLWNPHSVPLAPATYQVAWRTNAGRTFSFKRVSPSTTLASLPLSGFFIFDVVVEEPIPPGRSLVYRVKADPDSAAGNVSYVSGETRLVHKADDGTSAIIEGTGGNLTAQDLVDGIEWSVSHTGGDTMRLVLRSKSTSNPNGEGAEAGEYQAVRSIGFGNFAADKIDTDIRPESDVTSARTVFSMFTRMAGSTSGATFRWIANQNYRARFSPRPTQDGNNHSIWYGGQTAFGSTVNPLLVAEGGLRANAGGSVTASTANDLVLSEVLPVDAELTSLAQLQHANASLISHYPAYAIGNSLASPYIALGDTSVSIANTPNYPDFHDVSWLLNRDLWDRYYFSTIPKSLTATDVASAAFHLPNSRHVFTGQPDIARLNRNTAFDTAAADLRLRGGFNVNSTSREAWRAFLAGHLGIETSGAFRHPYSRFVKPIGTPNQLLEGYRLLDDSQIKILADKIVDEVLARGPFFSLADFVNRRLVIRGRDTSTAQQFKGVLQAAIDNADTEPSTPAINTDTGFLGNNAGSAPPLLHQPQFQGGPTIVRPVSSRLAFAPGYLTQADLLTAIGPALTARSDTFVIRAYGEAINPVTQATEGKAWCEALVQRSSRYVEDGINEWDKPAAGSDAEKFGRRFEVIAFRWLARDGL